MGWFILACFILIIAMIIKGRCFPEGGVVKKTLPGGFIVGVTAPHYAATVEKLTKGEDSK